MSPFAFFFGFPCTPDGNEHVQTLPKAADVPSSRLAIDNARTRHGIHGTGSFEISTERERTGIHFNFSSGNPVLHATHYSFCASQGTHLLRNLGICRKLIKTTLISVYLRRDVIAVSGIIRVGAGVVVGGSLSGESLNHRRQDTLAVGAGRRVGGNRPGGDVFGVREWAGVGLVEVQSNGADVGVLVAMDSALAYFIARGVMRPGSCHLPSLVGDQREDVGVAVPASEGWETPVLRDSGDAGVVVVEGRVQSSPQVRRDSSAHENGEDLVLDAIGLILIECQQEKSVVPEVLVGHERLNEVAEELGAEGDVGVMGILGGSLAIVEAGRILSDLHWSC